MLALNSSFPNTLRRALTVLDVKLLFGMIRSNRSVVSGMKSRSSWRATAKMPSPTSAEPLILCYRMPNYDVQCSRLEQSDVALPEAPDAGNTERAWLAEASVPCSVDVIDAPEGRLAELRCAQPLSPGVYALHWGALDGYLTTDPRVFMFAVVAEEEPPEGESEDEATPGGEAG